MQRDVSSHDGASQQPRPCPVCGGRLRLSHRSYAGAGTSTAVMVCTACGRTVTGSTRSDAERRGQGRAGRSKRHQPVDEGPPTNPVLDPALARRLLEDLTD